MEFDNHRISVFRLQDGTLVKHIGAGKQRSGDGELHYPYGVVLASNCIYVADWGNHRVSVFSQSDGRFLRHVGAGQGDGAGQLYSPTGIAEIKYGLLYVSEEKNHRISVFRAEDGRYVRHVGERGNGAEQFNEPFLLHINQHKLYLADYGNRRVRVFQF